jgi:hypothetical protein
MAYLRRLLVGALGALTLVGAGAVAVGAQSDALVSFGSMTPVSNAVKGTQNDRGIFAGAAPWVITSGTGQVDRQGNVSVQVRGLIIPILTPPSNPIANFSATVSCMTPDGVVNVTTALSPATSAGDSTINGTVDMPRPCKAPEVFVGTTKSNGVFIWFAESNVQTGD